MGVHTHLRRWPKLSRKGCELARATPRASVCVQSRLRAGLALFLSLLRLGLKARLQLREYLRDVVALKRHPVRARHP